MLHIEDYDNTIMINNDIEEIIIDQLKHPLDNIPPMVNKITVKKSINIYKRQNRIPYGCASIIENITINNYLFIKLNMIYLSLDGWRQNKNI